LDIVLFDAPPAGYRFYHIAYVAANLAKFGRKKTIGNISSNYPMLA
jgi:hypothetical protein